MLRTNTIQEILLIGLLSLLILSQARTVSAGENIWTSNGPEDGFIQALAIDPLTPSTLWAGTHYGGVFKSENSGGNWVPINTGLTNIGVNSLAIDPVTHGTLYAGTQDGVFKSTNGGENWIAVNTSLVNTNVLALAIDPLTPLTVYAGTNGGDGVFKSTNCGGNWTPKKTGLTNTTVLALAIDPLSPGTLYAGTGDGVFRSFDGGDSWGATLTDAAVFALAINLRTPSRSMQGQATTAYTRPRMAVETGTSSTPV